jgi:hypothetical protein
LSFTLNNPLSVKLSPPRDTPFVEGSVMVPVKSSVVPVRPDWNGASRTIVSGYGFAFAAVAATRKAAIVRGSTSNLLKVFIFSSEFLVVVIDMDVSPD